jgi:hypothetical protein
MSSISRTVLTGAAIARAVDRSVRQEVIRDVVAKAESYIVENKLMHAGAARALAERLKAELGQVGGKQPEKGKQT